MSKDENHRELTEAGEKILKYSGNCSLTTLRSQWQADRVARLGPEDLPSPP